MGIYEDMANDAGYAYETDENQQMADCIQYEAQREYNEELEQDYWETVREERRLEILFRKFN